MCVVTIEFVFLIAGIWLLISGKIPNKPFSLLFGKGDYQLPALHARLFGLLLSSPIPIVLIVSSILDSLLPQDKFEQVVSIFEIAYDFLVTILAILIARKSKRPASR